MKNICCIIMVAACVLGLATSLADADDTPLARELVRQYLEGSARVRQYYSEIYMRVKFWEKQEASEIKCPRLPIARESTLNQQLTIWVKGDYVRVDAVGDPPGAVVVWVTWPGAPNGFSAYRYEKDRGWRALMFRRPLPGEDKHTGTKQIAQVPFVMFAWGGWWPFEQLFLDPNIKVVQVKRVERNGRKLVQVDIENRMYYEELGTVSNNSWFFDTELGWVPVFSEGTTKQKDLIVAENDSGDLEYRYAVTEDGIPLLKSYETRSQRVINERIGTADCVYLVKRHTRYEVIEIAKEVPESVFQPESLGIPRWQIWGAWWRYYVWHRYGLGWLVPPIFYWTQLAVVILLVSWIAYRRWRRRLAAGSGVANASA